MKPEIKQQWVEALRSGKFVQGDTFLQRKGKYCCLGVLCVVQGYEPEANLPLFKFGTDESPLKTSTLPDELSAGLDGEAMSELAGMNDRGWTFEAIATFIEEKL